MPSEAEKYWQYSRECTKQALEAQEPELRDQLLDLARVWTEPATREAMHARVSWPTTPRRVLETSGNE